MLPGNSRQVRTNYRCSDQGLAGFACRASTTPDSALRQNQHAPLRNSNLSGIGHLRQGFVGTIAEWRICSVFALAPPHRFFLGNLVFQGLETSPLVRTIAKWRMSGATAGAPPMNARFDFQREWLGITNDGLLGHGSQWVGENVANSASDSLLACSKCCCGETAAAVFSSFG